MANVTNVRFYRLSALPSFEAKYKGIFVHVTFNLTRHLLEDKVTYEYRWDGKLTDKEIQAIVIQEIVEKETTRPVLVPEWMDVRRIDTVESGLWFGGENGWELLSNDTSSGAITAAIDDKIATLHVDGYAQAKISGSTLTISGIKEDNGKIAKDTNNNLVIAIDGTYNESTNKIATQSTVTTEINGLNVDTIQTVDKTTSGNTTTLTFKGVKEANGKIAQGDGATTFTVGNANLKIQIGSDEATNVFSANATEDSTIKLDGNVFKKEGDVFSIYTTEGVSSSNPLVTQQDIANLGGAMHYKGPLTGAQSGAGSWPSTIAAGDVYIVTTSFTHSGESNPFEVGDMIVFNSTSASDYKVIQSNLTLGIGDGQVAANVGALADGMLVVGVNSATGKGIKTVNFDVTNLTGTTGKNERTLKIENGTADTLVASLYHDVTITDDFTVIGKPFTETINISSTNRSIEIAANASENATGVVVDLVWNTTMEA